MTLQIELPTQLEQQLIQESAISGKPLDKLVVQTLQERFSTASTPKTLSLEEWNSLLQETIELHPQAEHELDVSRESIYEGRGE
jgi:hypothetical protein